MEKRNPNPKLWILIAVAAVLVVGAVIGILFATGVFGGGNDAYSIKLDNTNVYFEYGKKINLPDTTVYDRSGNEVAYDATCIGMKAPDGSEIDVSTGIVTPTQVGTYVLTYESVSMNAKTDIKIECKDTINPTLEVEVPEAFLIKEAFEDTAYSVFTLPIITADDLAGIDSSRTSVVITLNDKPVTMTGDKFSFTEEGKVKFVFTVYDLNGLSTTVTKESVAEMPEFFPEFCLSTFAKDTYLTKLCGGWLNSWYQASILDKDTDAAGNTMEGVLKITYDASDKEAGACIHLARAVKLADVKTLDITLRLEGNGFTAGVIDAIFYQAGYRDGFWTIDNLSTTVGSNYVTIRLDKNVLKTMTDKDGYIREFQIETFGDGSTVRSLYIADISYTPDDGTSTPDTPDVDKPAHKPVDTSKLPEGTLSAFDQEGYLDLICGGWLNSNYTASILDTDTDKSGMKHNGVLKITYPVGDKEAGACIHLAKPIKASDIDTLLITLRTTGCKINVDGHSIVIYKANYVNGYWTTHNLGAKVESDYMTITLEGNVLNSLADEDGYIRQFQIETFGEGSAERSLYIADISYTVENTGSDVPAGNVIKVNGVHSASGINTLYLEVNIDLNKDNAAFHFIHEECNEEDYILFNGAKIDWSKRELLATGDGWTNHFYIGKLDAKKGDKITIKSGFAVTMSDGTYETTKDYNFWFNGTTWTTVEVQPDAPSTDKTLTISGVQDFSSKDAVYFIINTDTGFPLYGSMGGACNEEDYILINNAKLNWANYELCAFEGNCFYINKVNAAKGTKITFKSGFKMTLNGENYALAEDYNVWWSGSAWTTTEVKADKTLTITGVHEASTDKNTLYLGVDANLNQTVNDFHFIHDLCNEEDFILFNGAKMDWSGKEILATGGGWYNHFYIGKIGAVKGDKITIKTGFTMELEDGNYITDKDYNFWWSGSAWTTVEVQPDAPSTDKTLTISGMETYSDKNTVYFIINAETGIANWNDMAGVCNEENFILINDALVDWTAKEIRAFESTRFYVGNIGAAVGTKVTIKAGFIMTLKGENYVLAEDYNVWWNGSAWTTTEVKADKTLTIISVDAASASNTLYLKVNADLNQGNEGFHDIIGICNEEEYILFNGVAVNWSGKEIYATGGGWYNHFYINGIGAAVGDKVTIKTGFTMALEDGNYVTTQDYNFWWNGSAWTTEEVKDDGPIPGKPLTFSGVQDFSSKDAVYFIINTNTGFPLYGSMNSACNEEDYILINDAKLTWANYELCAFEGNCFYINKVNAAKGTKITFKAGFTMTLNGENYVLAEDYNVWWNGSAWTTTEVKPNKQLVISGMETYSDKNTVYFIINAETGIANWNDMAGVCNEENFILINDALVDWTAKEIRAFESTRFYVGNIGAAVGTKVTIKAGFAMTLKGENYELAEDYNVWWNGSAWVTTEVVADKPLNIITVHSASNANTMYLEVNANLNQSIAGFHDIIGICNEEEYILVNNVAVNWSGKEIYATGDGWTNHFYINGIGAAVGDKVTIKTGFTMTLEDGNYVTTQDYNFWWNGTAWTTENPTTAPEGT